MNSGTICVSSDSAGTHLKRDPKAPTQGALRPVHTGQCHNCDAPVSGNFCPNCGQETVLHVASAREFMHEFIGHYVALEGKLWKSLGLLLFRPGRLTAEYIAGRRVRFIQPLRLYLTMSILFFAVLKYGGHSFKDLTDTGDGKPVMSVDTNSETLGLKGGITIHRPLKPSEVKPETKGFNISSKLGEINPEWGRKLQHLNELTLSQQQTLLVDAFFAYVPYAMFLLMPVFALLLKLLYLGSGRKYGEHLLFALHTNAFAFAMIGLALVAVYGVLEAALMVWLVVYLPMAMRRVYGGGRLTTWLRWIVLMVVHVMAMVMMIVFAMIAFALSH